MPEIKVTKVLDVPLTAEAEADIAAAHFAFRKWVELPLSASLVEREEARKKWQELAVAISHYLLVPYITAMGLNNPLVKEGDLPHEPQGEEVQDGGDQ